jgi:hypothetical protein
VVGPTCSAANVRGRRLIATRRSSPSGRAQVGLGELSQQMSKREQARDHLTTVITMCREMDMRLWLEQTEVEMGGLASWL